VYFDFVNVMSYDAIGPSWGSPGSEHSPYEAAARDLALWRARGVPKERLVLGVPYYGYGFGSYRPNWTYRDLIETFGRAAEATDVVGTACAGCSYITFNTPSTIGRKARLAAEEAAGVMVWEVSQDDEQGALLKAVRQGLHDRSRRPSADPRRLQ
jgi:chitinase